MIRMTESITVVVPKVHLDLSLTLMRGLVDAVGGCTVRQSQGEWVGDSGCLADEEVKEILCYFPPGKRSKVQGIVAQCICDLLLAGEESVLIIDGTTAELYYHADAALLRAMIEEANHA